MTRHLLLCQEAEHPMLFVVHDDTLWGYVEKTVRRTQCGKLSGTLAQSSLLATVSQTRY
ncbi:MAG: hypothetical protein ACI9VM_000802 [Candidatus Azotimanducaceae bacterium]|jgi:hypothetical protein